jgi:hypothetical protein
MIIIFLDKVEVSLSTLAVLIVKSAIKICLLDSPQALISHKLIDIFYGNLALDASQPCDPGRLRRIGP